MRGQFRSCTPAARRSYIPEPVTHAITKSAEVDPLREWLKATGVLETRGDTRGLLHSIDLCLVPGSSLPLLTLAWQSDVPSVSVEKCMPTLRFREEVYANSATLRLR